MNAIQRLFHRHNYEIEFMGNFDYQLRCPCGDVTPNVDTALDRVRSSMVKQNMLVIAIGLGVLGVLLSTL